MYKVLIVDDEQLIREGIRDGINWFSIECEIPISAENGIEAIKIIEKEHIDIVITDIKMPGINGLELSKFIHEKYESIKIIILSGYDDFKFAQDAIRYGVTDFILKPTKLEDIEENIKKIDKLFKEEKIKSIRIKGAEINIHKIDIYDKTQLIEKLIFGCSSDLIKNSQLQYISFMKDKYFILLFLSKSNKINKDRFYDITNNIIKNTLMDIGKYLPFNLFLGMSYIDMNILNVKNLYYDAFKKLDIDEKKNLLLDENGTIGDINVEEIFKLRLKASISNKDIQKTCEDIDDLFIKLELNDMNYVKCVAIHLVNYSINQLAETKNISIEKGYSDIITSLDRIDIKNMVKKFLREIITNEDVICEVNNELKERLLIYIKSNYAKKLKIEEMSDHFYISPGHLSRILKKYFQKTFSDILNEIRIENAAVFLKSHKYKAYEVASAVGFSDPKYFSQVFKKHTGKTPSDFK